MSVMTVIYLVSWIRKQLCAYHIAILTRNSNRNLTPWELKVTVSSHRKSFSFSKYFHQAVSVEGRNKWLWNFKAVFLITFSNFLYANNYWHTYTPSSSTVVRARCMPIDLVDIFSLHIFTAFKWAFFLIDVFTAIGSACRVSSDSKKNAVFSCVPV